MLWELSCWHLWGTMTQAIHPDIDAALSHITTNALELSQCRDGAGYLTKGAGAGRAGISPLCFTLQNHILPNPIERSFSFYFCSSLPRALMYSVGLGWGHSSYPLLHSLYFNSTGPCHYILWVNGVWIHQYEYHKKGHKDCVLLMS